MQHPWDAISWECSILGMQYPGNAASEGCSILGMVSPVGTHHPGIYHPGMTQRRGISYSNNNFMPKPMEKRGPAILEKCKEENLFEFH
jgi:hypothetical protein